MAPEHVRHLAKIGGTHNRRADNDELFDLLAAEVVEAVCRTPWDAERLTGPHLDRCAVNSPGQNALDAVEDLLVSVVLMRRCRQAASGLAATRNSNTDRLQLVSSRISRNRISIPV